jgi:hypothetical protein
VKETTGDCPNCKMRHECGEIPPECNLVGPSVTVCAAADLPCEALELRPEILRFAQIMESKMREGETKRGDWRSYTLPELLRRMKEERDELYRELWNPKGIDKAKVVRETADNANVQMMIAVVIGEMESEVQAG